MTKNRTQMQFLARPAPVESRQLAVLLASCHLLQLPRFDGCRNRQGKRRSCTRKNSAVVSSFHPAPQKANSARCRDFTDAEKLPESEKWNKLRENQLINEDNIRFPYFLMRNIDSFDFSPLSMVPAESLVHPVDI